MPQPGGVPSGPKRRYDLAPAPVKVSVSLIYVQATLLALTAIAVNVTLARTPGGETGRWNWSGLIAGIAVLYLVLAYKLLQGREWARQVTIGLTLATMVPAVFFFQAWFCFGIAFGLILVAGLLTADARSFFAGTYDPDADR